MAYLTLTTLPLLLLSCCNILTANSKGILGSEPAPLRVCSDAVQEVTVNLTTSLHELDRKYLSIAMSPRRVKNKYEGAQKLINLAVALAPADARVGGTAVNFMTFIPPASNAHTDQQSPVLEASNIDFPGEEPESFSFTGEEWESFNTFLTKANWDLLYDLNNFNWKADRSWDTTNAQQLLKYSAAKGIKIPYLQIGNEPSAYPHKYNLNITAKVLVDNYKTLKKLLSKFPLYKSTQLCGPDVSNIGVSRNAKEYLQGFVSNGAYNVVDALSVHFYYVNGATATINEFLSVEILDTLKTMLDTAVGIINSSPKPLPLQLTETASAYGGGAPGLSDTYASGFLWLDKLGLAAKYRVSRVFRQDLNGGAYGILDGDSDPRPDYFLSLVFKKLIEGPVFDVSLKEVNKNLRVYANCATKDAYPSGALVVYFVNLADTDAVISLPQYQNADLDLYLLTSGDRKKLTSSSVKLNGDVLEMSGDDLPTIKPLSHKGDVTVEAHSFGFIVVPSAKVALCMNYFSNVGLADMRQ
ncbi:unnamed protein product [Candidula unifasciata]|uniref:Beta-glucuronidase n=1 Tax=Candidula unifasciata TaxID=100452 RepID=A0A8S3ZEN6_9EUPU|nr:unnamed protein product [Candidula unifasciata]